MYSLVSRYDSLSASFTNFSNGNRGHMGDIIFQAQPTLTRLWHLPCHWRCFGTRKPDTWRGQRSSPARVPAIPSRWRRTTRSAATWVPIGERVPPKTLLIVYPFSYLTCFVVRRLCCCCSLQSQQRECAQVSQISTCLVFLACHWWEHDASSARPRKMVVDASVSHRGTFRFLSPPLLTYIRVDGCIDRSRYLVADAPWRGEGESASFWFGNASPSVWCRCC